MRQVGGFVEYYTQECSSGVFALVMGQHTKATFADALIEGLGNLEIPKWSIKMVREWCYYDAIMMRFGYHNL